MATQDRPHSTIDWSAHLGSDDQRVAILKSAYAGSIVTSLASPVIHDLSQPLVAIRYYSELLVQRLQDHPDAQLNKIANSLVNLAQTATDSISDLRGFITYREGEFRNINLSELLLSLLRIIKIDCKSSSIDLTSNIAQNLRMVGDAPQLRLAVHALVKSLLKLSLRDSESKKMHISLLAEDSHAQLLVGIGNFLPADVQKLKFSALEIDSAQNSQDLGLFLSCLILGQHQAKLALNQDSNASAVYRVMFPLI